MGRLSYIILLCSVWYLTFGVLTFESISAVRVYDEKRLKELREEVLSVFYHGYNSYIDHAYPYDELRPLSCDGVDTWGSYSLTLIDTLDTLAVIGNYSEFRRVAQLILDNANFDMNINVSVFETNIRILGGLLSAHLLSQKAGMDVEPGWPCQGPLLRLAELVAKKLLPAFDTPTGMPFGTVNLRYGVPPQETPVTCTAGVGTFVIEFGALSRLTGDPIYEKVALKAIHALYTRRSPLNLVGNHIDTRTGKWTAVDSGIGAGVDSYFEYLVKGGILFQKPELMHMFRVFHRAIDKYLGKGGWYVWATMGQGHISSATFQSLETFWPGMLSLLGDFKSGLKSMTNYHRILKQYGGLPELYNILQGKATHQREGYPLRPEFIESAMYLYRATGDPYMLEIGEDMLHAIEYNTRTDCGYSTIRDVTTLTLEDRMESFFLSETLKYLYLLFDPDNFIHSEGDEVTIVETPHGKCTVYAGGYIFNTEAHPIDPAALNCCTGIREEELHKEIEVIDELRSSKVFAAHKKVKRKFKKKTKKSEPEQQNAQNVSVSVSDPQPPPPISITGRVEEQNTVKINIDFDMPMPKLPVSKGKCQKPANPLLDDHTYQKQKITPIFRRTIKLDPFQSLQNVGSSESQDFVVKLLKKLMDEQTDYKELVRKEFAEGVEKGLQFVSLDDTKDLAKLMQDFESNLKVVEQELKLKTEDTTTATSAQLTLEGDHDSSSRPKKEISTRTLQSKENRIKSHSQYGESSPDLDALFSNNDRSLSYQFSLKWLPNFPDLIRHIIPSETFDIQKLYAKMSTEYSTENFVKISNISRRWLDNFDALRCSTIKMADRFMFFRSSGEE